MRIKSPFKDYYDGVQAYGSDDGIIWIRKTQMIRRWTEFKQDNEFLSNWRNGYFVMGVIGYCGSIYPVLVSTSPGEWNPEKKEWGPSTVNAGLYTVDECIKQAALEFEKEKLKPQQEGRTYLRSFSHFPTNNKALDLCEKYLTQYKGEQHQKTFAEFKCPTFFTMHCSNYLRINPCLKDLGFAKIKTPFEAYTDIASYMSGVLGQPPKPIPEIDDVTLAEIKGFDKFSFRKDKQNKKRR